MKQSFTTDELKKMKKPELYQLAQKLSIKGRSTMSKVQLLSELIKLDQKKLVVEDAKVIPDKEIKSQTSLKKDAVAVKETVGKEKKIAEPKKKKVNAEKKVVNTTKKTVSKRKVNPAVSSQNDEVDTPSTTLLEANDTNTPEDNIKDILNRSFGKKTDAASKKKKGARVTKSSKSYDLTDSSNENGKKSELDKISAKSRNLKSTMEIPVFPVPLPSSVQTVDEKDLTGELPQDYGEPRIVIQIRDPHLIHAYWEIPPTEKRRLERTVGIFEFIHSHYVLRVHNVSDGASYDVRVPQDARGWYLQLERAMTVYQVEVGLVSPTEGYNFIAISNLVQTPPDAVASDWAQPAYTPVQQSGQHQKNKPQPQFDANDDMANQKTEADRPTRRIAGHEVPSEIPENIQNLSNPWSVFGIPQKPEADARNQVINSFPLQTTMPSSDTVNLSSNDSFPIDMPGSMPSSFEMPSSDQVGGSFGVVKKTNNEKIGKEKDFWLVVNTELILYGATEPDAKVTVQGQVVKLNPDGTFMLKYALPDGIIELPVKAVNADGDMERFVMPVVTRQTY